jgi:glucokinase
VRVLAGDIGGTKTAVAIVEIGPKSLSVERFERYESAGHSSLEEILEDFLRGVGRPPRIAGFGVAGPVVQGRSRITKLPWTIDERVVSRELAIPRVRVENDFVAAALGIPYLKPRQVATLAKGRPEKNGPIGLIGAGTGLGQAALAPGGGTLYPLPSQGGHADFGPRSDREDRLVRFVRARFGRVSRDRLLSGEGLAHIYDFLKEEGAARESAEAAAAFATEDRGAVIGRLGLSRSDALSAAALDLFVEIYGSEAGNLALQYRATGGLYVGGGIAVRILPGLKSGSFMRAFREKPPMEELLAKIPVRVVLEPRLGLYGAAAVAYRTAT